MVVKRTSPELIRSVDFGEPDGLFDPHLSNYFIDFRYWEDVIDSDRYFVIGRKGTGKSAIYKWIQQVSVDRGALVANLSFRDFPFEKLLQLSDDDFQAPNQYQSIWRNIILSELARMVASDQLAPVTDHWRMLKDYVDFFFGTDLVDTHKQVTDATRKTGTGLQKVVQWNEEKTTTETYAKDFSQVTQANRRLMEVLRQQFLVSSPERHYFVQFDQLDDNFNQYTQKDSFFQCLVSLFKAIYDINQTFRSEGISARAIAYLRSDIYTTMHSADAESARWDPFTYYLNWAIIRRPDWGNPRLLQVINRRICASISDLKVDNPFNKVFDNEAIRLRERGRKKPVFRYMVDRSFHRPRDLIQFCNAAKRRTAESRRLDNQTMISAENDYSLWFMTELENEIGHRFNDINDLYEFLRILGKGHYTLKEFSDHYARFRAAIGFDPEELIRFLYDAGIVLNIDISKRPFERFSVIRNERSRFSRSMHVTLHQALLSGLNASTH